MPVYEPEKKGLGWPAYLAIGCGGCAVLVVLFFVGTMVFGLFMARKAMNVAMSTAPVKRTTPYKYGVWSLLRTVDVELPEHYGRLTYGQGVSQVLKLNGKSWSQEWPLPDKKNWSDVTVYWHPKAGGRGPFVRFKDSERESLLDLQRREVGSVGRMDGHAYICDYRYDDSGFWMQENVITTVVNGKTVRTMVSTKGLAPDVTAALSPSNCRCLGTIVRKGNKLVVAPASGGKAKPASPSLDGLKTIRS